MKKIGLALGGGGARGLCHTKFIEALDELELKPSIIAGTSIGAIIGAFYASGLSGVQMENMLYEIDFKDLFKMMDFSFLSRSSLIKGRGVENFLKQNIPVSTFEELNIPLKIVATDFWREDDVVFDSGKLLPAIRSSISIPAIFEPVILDDKVLIDGGITNNLPYDLIRNECDILIAIDVSGSKLIPEKLKVPSWLDNIMSTIQILQSSIVEYQMKLYKPDIYIKPKLEDINLLDFEKVEKILLSVKDDVEDFKKEIEKKASKKLFKF